MREFYINIIQNIIYGYLEPDPVFAGININLCHDRYVENGSIIPWRHRESVQTESTHVHPCRLKPNMKPEQNMTGDRSLLRTYET